MRLNSESVDQDFLGSDNALTPFQLVGGSPEAALHPVKNGSTP
jgi:hypothetical protein